MGIQNFKQLNHLSHSDRKRLQNYFRHRGWTLDLDQWRIASQGNTKNPSNEAIRTRAAEISIIRENAQLNGGERTDWEQAEWELRGNPIFFYGVPTVILDFAFTQAGLGPEARDELYRMGIYNLEQVKSLDQTQRAQIVRWFKHERFEVDIAKALGWR